VFGLGTFGAGLGAFDLHFESFIERCLMINGHFCARFTAAALRTLATVCGAPQTAAYAVAVVVIAVAGIVVAVAVVLVLMLLIIIIVVVINCWTV